MTHRASSNRCPARGLQQGRPENTWARVILSSIDQEIHLMCSQFDPAGTFSHMIFFSEITLPKSAALEASIPFLQDLVVAIDCTCSFSHHWGRIWGVVLPFGRQQKYVLLPVSMSERAGASTACTASTQSLTPAVQSAPREVPIYEFDPSTSMQNYTSEIHRWLHRVATRPRRNVLLAYQFSGEGLTSAKQAWY
jgi:hypothetical protein